MKELFKDYLKSILIIPFEKRLNYSKPSPTPLITTGPTLK